MDQLHLMKWSTALVILMGAGCQFALAQSKDSASKDSVQLIARLQGPRSVQAFAFSPDGRILAASYSWHSVIFWDVAKAERHATLDEPQLRNAGTLVFTPDGKRLAMTGGAESVEIWDVSNRKKVIDLKDQIDQGVLLSWIAFSRDGKLMAAGGLNLRPLITTLNLAAS